MAALDDHRRDGAAARKRDGRKLEGLEFDRDEIGRALDRAAQLEWQTMPVAFREQAITELLTDIDGAEKVTGTYQKGNSPAASGGSPTSPCITDFDQSKSST